MVDLPSATMGNQVAAVDDGVTEGLVRVVDRDLGTQTAGLTKLGGVLHLFKTAQVLLNREIAALGSNTVHTLSTHLLLSGGIGVGLALLDQLDGVVVDGVKVVGGVGDNRRVDSDQEKVLLDRVLVLNLLLAGVGIIETDNQASLVLVSKVLVEEGSLGVSNVQVTRRLWGETGNNLAHLGANQVDVEGSLIILGLLRFQVAEEICKS